MNSTPAPSQFDTNEDHGWVEQYRRGSNDAAGKLVAKYQRPLIGFILGRCTCSQDDAEDMAQEIWARSLPELGKSADEGGFDPAKGTFYTYLINRHGKFAVMQFIDRKKRRPEALTINEGGEDDDQGFEIPDDADDPETAMVVREELLARQAVLVECFRLTFLYGGYPHQVLAFGYSKLIYGQSTKRESDAAQVTKKRQREVEGDPKRVDAEHGNDQLRELTEHFWDSFLHISALDETGVERLSGCMVPLRERLPLTVEQMAADNKVFRDHHVQIVKQVVGQTALRDYYGGRGLNAITDWCDKVQNRVREKLGIGRQK